MPKIDVASRYGRSSFRRLFASAVILCLTCVSMYADAMYGVSIVVPGNSSDHPLSGTSTVSETIGSPLPVPGSDINAFAQAIAGPDDLGVYGNVSASGPPGAGPVLAGAGETASLRDSLLLTNAPSNGELAIYADIEGSIYTLAQNFGSPEAFARVSGESNAGRPHSGSCVALANLPQQPYDCGLLHDGINVLTVPYILTYNHVIPLGLDFEASETCEAAYWDQTVGSCIAASEFLDTARIASIVVEDPAGNAVADATATSLSGVNYSLPSTAAPEPNTISLFSIALVGTLVLTVKKGGRSRT